MKKPELLAPAGNMESLRAAIEAGCDAVYVGGYMFGARSFAGNFSDDELRDAVLLCHLYGVKLYVTVNTLIYEDEVDLFVSYVDYLVSISVDALIMQDLGMIDLVHQLYPEFELHASTQMHVHNLNGVLQAEKLGMKRVVLARETSVDLIREIKSQTDLELEIFVHGALCISYSGQCLMSSLIGGRSGNRGTCAGSCRKGYSFISDDKQVNDRDHNYLLSTKDLMTLEYIGELIDIGVESFKIEGRMKRPEYVYYVVSLYRKAIDQYCSTGKIDIQKQDIYDLKKIFHREFTKGFLFHERNQNIVQTYRPNHLGVPVGEVLKSNGNKIFIRLTDDLACGDGIRIIGDSDTGLMITKMFCEGMDVKQAFSGSVVAIPYDQNVKSNCKVVKTTDERQLSDLKTRIQLHLRKVMIEGKLTIHLNQPMCLEVSDGKNVVQAYSECVVENAIKAPLTEDRVRKQMNRMGDFVYAFSHLSIEIDDDVFVVISELNELRRRALSMLNDKRLERKKIFKKTYSREGVDFSKVQERSCLVHSYDHYQAISNMSFERIYVSSMELYKKVLDDFRVMYRFPRVLEHPISFSDSALIGELGSVYNRSNFRTDFSFNVVNSYTACLLFSWGAKCVTLSYELTDEQIVSIIEAYQSRYHCYPCFELIVYGNEEAMVSKYRMLSHYGVKSGYLKDEYQNLFPVVERDQFTYVYYYRPRNLKSNYYDMGISSLCYHILTDEDVDILKEMLECE